MARSSSSRASGSTSVASRVCTARFHESLLVLCGGEDYVTPVDACREVATAYNDAPFDVLPGLGHASYVEGPDLFNLAVEQFLEMSHA